MSTLREDIRQLRRSLEAALVRAEKEGAVEVMMQLEYVKPWLRGAAKAAYYHELNELPDD